MMRSVAGSQRPRNLRTFAILINAQSLDLVFSGFKTVYTEACLAAPTHSGKVAMTVPSSGRDATYGWIEQFPQLREGIGPRHIHGLSAHSFKIVNRDFESTVSVSKNDIMDDRLGVFKPSFAEIGAPCARVSRRADRRAAARRL